MSTAQAPDDPLHIDNDHYEVLSHRVGKSLVDVIRKHLTSGKIRRGDYYFGRMQTMIRQHYAQLEFEDKMKIEFEIESTVDVKETLEDAKSILQRFMLAREYKRVSKDTFKIVERASSRARNNNNIIDQISVALGGGATPPSPTGTTNPFSNTFGDSPAVTTLTEVDVGNLNQVEMSTFQSEVTGETTVVVELQGLDGTTQEFAATIPFVVVSGDGIGEGAETASVSSYDSVGHEFYGPPSEAGSDEGR